MSGWRVWRDVWVGVALVVGITAQSTAQLEEQRLGYWPDEGPSDSQCVVLRDFNGDGHVDAFLGRGILFENRAVSALMLGKGDGGFRAAPSGSWPQVERAGMSVAAADVDRDGDVDLVLGDAASGVRLYRNDGRARFTDDTAASIPKVRTAVRAVAVADFDRDGDPDLVIGSDRVPAQLLRNDGRGRFAPWSGGLPADRWRTTAVEVFDANGDGQLDLWVGVGDGQDRLWMQYAPGLFRDETGVRLPSDPAGTDAVAIADIEGDGDLDVVVAGIGEPVRLWLNEGRGRFRAAPAGSVPSAPRSCRALAVFDFDRDGDQDLVVGAAGHPETSWWRNGGRADFAELTTGVPTGLGGVAALASADLDRDGDRDLVVATHQGELDRVVLGDGGGRFVGAWHEAVRGRVGGVRRVVAGDWNGDGEPDLAVARFGERATVALQDPNGTLVFATDRLPSTRLWATDVARGDWDRDGAMDLAFATWFQGTKLWFGDGRGGFREGAASRVPSHNGRAQAIVSVDVDGDRDLDLVVGCDSGSPSRLYRNQGDGRFVDSSWNLPQNQQPVLAMLATDVDADGDVDLVVATALHATTRLWENDGTGRYRDRPAHVPVDMLSHPAIAALDVDRDGDVDLVLGGASAPCKLWHNDGAGRFTLAPKGALPSRSVVSTAVQAGDLDGDGDDDLIVATSDGFDWHLRNDGGRLVEVGALGARPEWTEDLVMIDLDRDADLDVVLLAPGLARVFRNRRQDLVPTRLARTRRRLGLRAFGRPNGGRAADAIVFAGVAATRPLPTPVGWLRLVPSPIVPLGVVHLSPAEGAGEIWLAIPADPALVGQSLAIQSLLRVPSRLEDTLTNAMRVKVRGQ